MAKTISINYGGERYDLTFTRESVRQMERAGFNIEKAMDTPMTSTETLFTGAFLANHGRAIKNRIPEKILANGIPRGMFDKLIEMYNEPLSEMFEDDEGDEKNLEWEANW